MAHEHRAQGEDLSFPLQKIEKRYMEKEVRQAMDAGIRVCTLGKRILRCETAPLCALSAIMYAAGEF